MNWEIALIIVRYDLPRRRQHQMLSHVALCRPKPINRKGFQGGGSRFKKRWSAPPSSDRNVEQTDVLKLFSIQISIATLQKYEMSLV